MRLFTFSIIIWSSITIAPCLSTLAQAAGKGVTSLLYVDRVEEAMPEKINDALLKQLEEAKRAGLEQKIPVIVTLAAGADTSVIEKKGLKRISEHVPLYAGTLTAVEIRELAQQSEVERIEYDERAWAL